jgi:hypothetical protein
MSGVGGGRAARRPDVTSVIVRPVNWNEEDDGKDDETLGAMGRAGGKTSGYPRYCLDGQLKRR